MELIGDRNLQSTAFLDYQMIGDDDDLIDRDCRRFVDGEIETASCKSSVVAPAAEDLVLQNFDASFAEMFHGFLHESSSSSQTHEIPGFSALE